MSQGQGSVTEPDVSLIILCYRAEDYIPECVASMEAELRQLGVRYEIVVVANYVPGRKDRSPQIALDLMRRNPHVNIVARPKEGMMGWDMRSGLEAAHGRVLMVIDGDGQIDPRDVARVYQELRARGLDLCQTSRIRREDGWQRVLVSHIYNVVFQILFPGTGLHDINAKPKAITREAYQSFRLSSTDWFTDADIIIQARRNRLRCGEIPSVFGKGVRPSFINLEAVWEFIRNLILFRFRETFGASEPLARRRGQDQSKIRVLHVIESLGLGGAERRLVSDLRWLDRERYDHRVVYLTTAQDLRAEIEALGIRAEGLKLRSVRQWPAGVVRLTRLLRAWRPEIVHTQVFGADVYGRISATLARVPIVLSTVQTMPYDPQLGPFYSRKRKVVDRLTARLWVDRFVAVSEAVREGLSREFGIRSSQISLIPNGVDLTRFAPRPAGRSAVRASLGLVDAEMVVLIVGRLIPEKNHATLIRAIHGLGREWSRVRLLIVGEGPLRVDLERLTDELGMRERVMLLGARTDVERVHAAADVFVLPSLREGFPVALLEAMASALPVIASSIPPHREIIEHGTTGWLVASKASDKLAEILAFVAGHPMEARAVAEEGRRLVQAQFSAETFAQQLQDLYDDLCHVPRRVDRRPVARAELVTAHS